MSLSPPVAWLDADPRALADDALVEGARALAEWKRVVEASLAAFASEVKHRSRPEDGFSGLAQRLGAITPENLVQRVTGSSKREATQLVRVGQLLTVDAEPWLTRVGSALAAGEVSVEQADVIRTGLGTPTADVAADDLADAAAQLLVEAPSLPVERLASRARAARDDLDAASVRDRHRALREKRYLTLTPLADGTTRLSGILDPDSAAIVKGAYDAATSPRRGGPRFVDAEAAAAVEKVVNDERTIGQLAVDTFVDLVRLGSEASPEQTFRSRRHAVHVLVTAHDLQHRTGAAFYGDSADAVPLETADRHICDAGILPTLFDDTGTHPLDAGRTHRLFTTRQRDALAARDGGCRFPDCDRPVSWCEAHHRQPWSRGGATDIDDGVLLCRHHHMLIHDTGWTIDPHPEHGFVAIPPRTRDPRQQPIPMPPRSPTAQRLAASVHERSGASSVPSQ